MARRPSCYQTITQVEKNIGKKEALIQKTSAQTLLTVF